jgi:hypothetical protein
MRAIVLAGTHPLSQGKRRLYNDDATLVCSTEKLSFGAVAFLIQNNTSRFTKDLTP